MKMMPLLTQPVLYRPVREISKINTRLPDGSTESGFTSAPIHTFRADEEVDYVTDQFHAHFARK